MYLINKLQLMLKQKSSPTDIFPSRKYIESMIIEVLESPAGEVNRIVDGSGNTLLHLAIQKFLVEPISSLIAAGARLDVFNQEGRSPIDVALETADQTIIQILQRFRLFEAQIEFNRSFSRWNAKRLSIETMISILNSSTSSLSTLRFDGLQSATLYEDYLDWSPAQRYAKLKVRI